MGEKGKRGGKREGKIWPFNHFFVPLHPDAFEVLVFKGTKSILVKRKAATDKDFVKKFMFAYYK